MVVLRISLHIGVTDGSRFNSPTIEKSRSGIIRAERQVGQLSGMLRTFDLRSSMENDTVYNVSCWSGGSGADSGTKIERKRKR